MGKGRTSSRPTYKILLTGPVCRGVNKHPDTRMLLNTRTMKPRKTPIREGASVKVPDRGTRQFHAEVEIPDPPALDLLPLIARWLVTMVLVVEPPTSSLLYAPGNLTRTLPSL